MNNIVTEVFNFNVSTYYLLTNRGSLLWLHTWHKQCTYCIIVSRLELQRTVDDFDKFD